MDDQNKIEIDGPKSEQLIARKNGTLVRKCYWQLDFIVALLLVAAPFNYRVILSGAPVGGLNMVDGSWIADLPFKLERGVLLGRDVVFSFGPMFQVITAAIPKIVGPGIGNIEKSFWVAPVSLATIALWICTR